MAKRAHIFNFKACLGSSVLRPEPPGDNIEKEASFCVPAVFPEPVMMCVKVMRKNTLLTAGSLPVLAGVRPKSLVSGSFNGMKERS